MPVSVRECASWRACARACLICFDLICFTNLLRLECDSVKPGEHAYFIYLFIYFILFIYLFIFPRYSSHIPSHINKRAFSTSHKYFP